MIEIVEVKIAGSQEKIMELAFYLYFMKVGVTFRTGGMLMFIKIVNALQEQWEKQR